MKPGAFPRGPKEVKPAACEGATVGETWSLRGLKADTREVPESW